MLGPKFFLKNLDNRPHSLEQPKTEAFHGKSAVVSVYDQPRQTIAFGMNHPVGWSINLLTDLGSTFDDFWNGAFAKVQGIVNPADPPVFPGLGSTTGQAADPDTGADIVEAPADPFLFTVNNMDKIAIVRPSANNAIHHLIIDDGRAMPTGELNFAYAVGGIIQRSIREEFSGPSLCQWSGHYSPFHSSSESDSSLSL
jgi:hypothetical protein